MALNLNQIVSKIVKAFTGEITKQAAQKGAAVEAEAAKTLSATKASKIAAGLKPFLIISAADAVIGKIPVLNEIVSRVQQLKDTMLDKTIGQIPLIGKPWMEGNRLAMGMLAPSARKYVQTATPESLINAINDSTSQVFNWFKKKDNDGNNKETKINNPKFYTALDMHTEFRIPMCYPDDAGVPFYGTKNIGSIGVITLSFNPVTSYSKQKARFTQMLDLLKGVRGLSGQLPYSEADIFFYDWNTKYLINEYFRLKFAIKLSRVYSLTKVLLPKQLLSKLGYDASDFIAHKADYVALLTDMHNYIHNSIPCFGMMNERIEDLINQLIPDSNDPKVALYYCVQLDITTLVPHDAGNDYYVYRSFFRKASSNLASTASTVNLDFNNSLSITYATYVANYTTFTTEFPYSHKAYASLKGDLVGAFGTSVIWNDKYINDVNTCTPESMYHKFDELFLTQIQNGTILDRLGVDINPGTGGNSDATVYEMELANLTLPTLTNGVLSNMIIPNVANRDYVHVMVGVNANNYQGSAGSIHMPQTDGAAVVSTPAISLTNETGVITNKPGLSEGEQLEIIQLTAWLDETYASYESSANKDKLFEYYQTQTFFIAKFEIMYKDVATGNNIDFRLRPTMYVPGTAAVFSFNAVRSLIQVGMFWSQSDYGPKMPLSVYYSGSSYDGMLLDFNIMGSISHSAYQIAVKYAAYSLYSAQIKMSDQTGKKINNIVDAYKVTK